MEGINIPSVSVAAHLVDATVNILPNLVGALIVWIFGLALAWVLSKISKEILVRLQVDRRLHLPSKGIFSTAEVIPIIIFWAIMLLAIQEGLNILELKVLSQFFGSIVNFLGGLTEAMIIVIAGYALTDYVTRQIKATKRPFADIIANSLFFLMMYITVAIALPFIGIDTTLINAILVIILGSLGLGFAIALGLGLKDTIARLAKSYERKVK